MASIARVLANRSNAQRSTGPRTPEGKAIVAQNAVKHGLLAQRAVVKGEDPGEFALYRDRMLEDLDPAGSVEAILAERIVNLAWRLGRAERLESAALAMLEAERLAKATALPAAFPQPKGGTLPEGETQADEESVLARVVVEDFGDDRLLDQLLGYERRIENSLYRTMGELRKQRILREVESSEFRLQAGQESGFPASAVLTPPEGGTPNSRVKAEPGSGSPTQDFAFGDPLQTVSSPSSLPASNVTVDTPDEPPCGVTTNGAGAERPSGETKPICRVPEEELVPCDKKEEEVGRGRPTYEEASCDVTTNGPQAERPFGETKPNEVSGSEFRLQAGGKSAVPASASPTPPEGGTPHSRVNAELGSQTPPFAFGDPLQTESSPSSLPTSHFTLETGGEPPCGQT